MPTSIRIRLLLSTLVLVLLGGATCHANKVRDEKAKEQAAIHYDLGVQAMQHCDSRGALTEFQQAIDMDASLAVAYNALGLVHHLSFAQLPEAIAAYQKALQLDPKFTEANTNLGNVYLAQARYEQAIPYFEKALADILYKTPYIAENNLGWCYYKKGEVQLGIDHIRGALVANPRFCLGHRNLGIIYTEMGQPEKALESYAKYAKNCPAKAEAHQLYGMALVKAGEREQAKKELAACAAKAREEEPTDNVKAEERAGDCHRLQDLNVAEACQQYLEALRE
jgi:Tfp pilus assembly protein PilF